VRNSEEHITQGTKNIERFETQTPRSRAFYFIQCSIFQSTYHYTIVS
jgi:hypothetical protein